MATPPKSILFKANSGCTMLDDWAYGWALAIEDSHGEICFAMMKQERGLKGSNYVEPRAFIAPIQSVCYNGFMNVIFEGDNTSLISKLKNRCASTLKFL